MGTPSIVSLSRFDARLCPLPNIGAIALGPAGPVAERGGPAVRWTRRGGQCATH